MHAPTSLKAKGCLLTFMPLPVVEKKPELKPPVLAGVQGLAKSPMMTEWLGAKNWYWMMSPIEAVAELGEKERPFLPTVMGIVFAVTKVREIARMSRDLKIIVTVGILLEIQCLLSMHLVLSWVRWSLCTGDGSPGFDGIDFQCPSKETKFPFEAVFSTKVPSRVVVTPFGSLDECVVLLISCPRHRRSILLIIVCQLLHAKVTGQESQFSCTPLLLWHPSGCFGF